MCAAVLQGQTSPGPLSSFIAPQGGVLGGTTIDGRIFANSFTVETRAGFFAGLALGVPVRDWLQLYTRAGLSAAQGDAFGAPDDISMQQLEGGIRLVKLSGPTVLPFVQLGVGARDLNGNSWRMRGLFANATAGVQLLPGRTTAFELSVSHAVGGYGATVALPAGVLAMLTGREGNEQWQRVGLLATTSSPACAQFL